MGRSSRGRRSAVVVGVLLAVLAPDLARAESWSDVRALLLAGRRIEARALADSLRAVSAQDEPSTEGRYVAALLLEDGDAAAEEFRALVRERLPDGLEEDLHLRLGRHAFTVGRFPEALDHFDEARKAGREEEGSLWAGLSAAALGDLGTGRDRLRRATQSGNARIRERAMLALGDLERQGGDADAALAWFTRVADERAEGGPGWFASAVWGRALAHAAQGRRDQEIAALVDLLRDAPAAYEAARAREQLRHLAAPAVAPSSADSASAPAPAATGRFAIQVGAFSMRENADSFAARFVERGFPARVESDSLTMHRVLVGRFADRPAAESAADSLAELTPTGYRIVELGAGGE